MNIVHELIELVKVSPSIVLDIRYATANNLVGRPVYSCGRCFLQKKTAERLHRVQMALQKRHLGLKVFDGYRPLSVQKIFWSYLPNPHFIADPAIGSNHNRGTAVDLTLVDALMPTDFDEMTERAFHDFQGGRFEALQNRAILKEAMMQEGFLPYPMEWWHYDDPDWEHYPILDISLECLANSL